MSGDHNMNQKTTGINEQQFHSPNPALYSGGDVEAVMAERQPIINLLMIQQTPKEKEMMDFGDALAALKAGQKVAREGWNGKGMWLCLVNPGNAMHLGYDMQPCIAMKTVDNKMQPGWLASQTDMLAEDWVLV